MTFDDQARQTISNLERLLNKTYVPQLPLVCKYSVGIEIEIKFRYFFPEIFKEYFENKKWFEYSEEQKNYISNLITEAEKDFLPTLNRIVKETTIERGHDKYFEYSFAPCNDLVLLYYQIQLLQKANLIPKEGDHSLHITIGGLDLNKESYYILMILELLFLTKERIKEGFSKDKPNTSSATWSKKGRAGILFKNQHDLVNQDKGVEFRTLTINGQMDTYYLFKVLNYLLSDDNINEKTIIFELVINKMKVFGLPDENWKNPHLNTIIWNRYIETFDELSIYTKELIKKYI